MILTVNNDSTHRPKSGDREKLAECDDVMLYKECGWYCLAGWQGKKRILHLHFDSDRERDFFIDPKAAAERYFKNDGSSYKNYYHNRVSNRS